MKDEINLRLHKALLKNKLLESSGKLELICGVSGKSRSTSKDYLKNKEQSGVDITDFQKYYVCRQALKYIKQNNSVSKAAEFFECSTPRLSDLDLDQILKFNS